MLQVVVIRVQLAEEAKDELDISLKIRLTGPFKGIAELYFSLGVGRLDSLPELCNSTGLIFKGYQWV